MKDRDLSEEIRAHIDEKTAELVASGVPEREARAQAHREFGNVTLISETSREVWGWPALDRLWQDLHFGARMMRRNPAFTAVVVLTLALGIGANTAIFSVAHSVLLAPLPYPAADRLVWISTIDDRFVGAPDFFDLQQQSRSFESMAAYSAQDSNLEADGEAGQTTVASLVGDVWSLTGARPAVGRLFRPGETGGIVLSYKTFEERFHSDPGVVGRSVNLDGAPAIVLGVLPRDFKFLLPVAIGIQAKEIQAYAGSSFTPENQRHDMPRIAGLEVVARRREGISLVQARSELQALMAGIKAQWLPKNPLMYRQMELRVVPLQDRIVRGARPALLVLLAVVAFVLLIACANVANLLLARAAARQREISIRTALGAGRMRVARQFLTESVMLALAGGLAGLLLANWGVEALIRFGPSDIPRLSSAAIDPWVLGATLALSLVTGLLFGMAPALSLSRGLHDTLKESARTASASTSTRRMRAVLAAFELALALVLLAGAGLMLKSIVRMNARPPGFDPEHTLIMKASLSGPRYRSSELRVAYFRTMLDRLRFTPGIEASGLNSQGFSGFAKVDELASEPLNPSNQSNIQIVSEGYLRAVGLRLVEGRWLTDRETEPVAVVNQAFIRSVTHGRNPIGMHVLRSRIVGVVADLKAHKLDADPPPEVYVLFYQTALPYTSMDVLIRALGDAAAAGSSLRKLIVETDPTQVVDGAKTLDRVLADSIAPRRFNLLLLAFFAAVAVVLASVGIYGVMSYTVTQRSPEIGVRMALGASRGEVVGMVVRQGMWITAAGLGAGLAAALALTRLMASLLFDVRPSDPETLAAVTAVLAAAALIACWLPARRASRMDPMTALRVE